MRLVPKGCTRWFQSAAIGLYAALCHGDPAVAGPFIQAITTVPVEPEPTGQYASAVLACCFAFVAMGQLEDGPVPRCTCGGDGGPTPRRSSSSLCATRGDSSISWTANSGPLLLA